MAQNSSSNESKSLQRLNFIEDLIQRPIRILHFVKFYILALDDFVRHFEVKKRLFHRIIIFNDFNQCNDSCLVYINTFDVDYIIF